MRRTTRRELRLLFLAAPGAVCVRVRVRVCVRVRVRVLVQEPPHSPWLVQTEDQHGGLLVASSSRCSGVLALHTSPLVGLYSALMGFAFLCLCSKTHGLDVFIVAVYFS